MKEALFYEKLERAKVQCFLCPHSCIIHDSEEGICRARINIKGTLYASSYGKTVTVHKDPVEKKPLYHFLPQTQTLSIGHNSCNLKCRFCQNYHISQMQSRTFDISVDQLVKHCLDNQIPSVSFTYTEPVTWFEFVLDASRELKKHNIKSIMVSNGYINPEPLKMLLEYVDAFNIDLKAFTDHFYQSLCSASLKPVLKAIELISESSHLEVTNLVIPEENDEDYTDIVDFISKLNPNIPLHFSKYYPQYEMMNPPTPDTILKEIYEYAKSRLNNVYLGNIITSGENNTVCPECGELIVERRNFKAIINKDFAGHCTDCNTRIYGIWR